MRLEVRGERTQRTSFASASSNFCKKNPRFFKQGFFHTLRLILPAVWLAQKNWNSARSKNIHKLNSRSCSTAPIFNFFRDILISGSRFQGRRDLRIKRTIHLRLRLRFIKYSIILCRVINEEIPVNRRNRFGIASLSRSRHHLCATQASTSQETENRKSYIYKNSHHFLLSTNITPVRVQSALRQCSSVHPERCCLHYRLRDSRRQCASCSPRPSA